MLISRTLPAFELNLYYLKGVLTNVKEFTQKEAEQEGFYAG